MQQFDVVFPARGTSFEEDAAQWCQDCCQKAIEQDPTNPEGYQLKASCLLSQENTEVSHLYAGQCCKLVTN